MLTHYAELRPVLIAGLLRLSETMNLIASPKSHKTFLAIYIGVCVAIGRALYGVLTVDQPGPVLYIDCELHRETWTKRLAAVCEAMGIEPDQLSGKLDQISLRGKLRDLVSLRPVFQAIPKGKYRLIVLDALYRLLPEDVDENSNADVTRLYNLLDDYAAATGAAILVIHHASKGNQGSKSVTDVGAGAGAQSRAADAHLVIRPHEVDGVAVLDAVVRSFPPIQPMCIRWEYPLWKLEPLLDPANVRVEGRRRAKPAPVETPPEPPVVAWTPASFVDAFVTKEPRPKDYIVTKATDAGITRQRAGSLLGCAIEDGLVVETMLREKGSPKRYQRV